MSLTDFQRGVARGLSYTAPALAVLFESVCQNPGAVAPHLADAAEMPTNWAYRRLRHLEGLGVVEVRLELTPTSAVPVKTYYPIEVVV